MAMFLEGENFRSGPVGGFRYDDDDFLGLSLVRKTSTSCVLVWLGWWLALTTYSGRYARTFCTALSPRGPRLFYPFFPLQKQHNF